MGIIGGGFLAVLIGEVDAAREMKGDLLRVYLALLTGVVGFLASRLIDRTVDRREIRRRSDHADYRIGRLLVAWTSFNEFTANCKSLERRDDQIALIDFGRQIHLSAISRPDFADLAARDVDKIQAYKAEMAFDTSQYMFRNVDGREMDDSERRDLAERYLSRNQDSTAAIAIRNLASARSHFGTYVSPH